MLDEGKVRLPQRRSSLLLVVRLWSVPLSIRYLLYLLSLVQPGYRCVYAQQCRLVRGYGEKMGVDVEARTCCDRETLRVMYSINILFPKGASDKQQLPN